MCPRVLPAGRCHSRRSASTDPLLHGLVGTAPPGADKHVNPPVRSVYSSGRAFISRSWKRSIAMKIGHVDAAE